MNKNNENSQSNKQTLNNQQNRVNMINNPNQQLRQNPMTQIQMISSQMQAQPVRQNVAKGNVEKLQLVEGNQIQNPQGNQNIEELNQMLKIQDKIHIENLQKSREVQLQTQVSPSLESMDTGSPKKNNKNKSTINKGTRTVPVSQQKMTKSSQNNLMLQNNQVLDKAQQQYKMQAWQGKTLQPKRQSSMAQAKLQQNHHQNNKFHQTIGAVGGTPKNNIYQIQNMMDNNQMITVNNSADYDEQMAGPTVTTTENHNFQVSRLQDHKNKKMVAQKVDQQMDNENYIQSVGQQPNKMKTKINIKFFPKTQGDNSVKVQQDQRVVENVYEMQGNQQSQMVKSSNPSIVQSDVYIGEYSARQKSPSYIQTLTAYSNNASKGAGMQKSSTKKSIKILSNSSSVKKHIQNNTNPTIVPTVNNPVPESLQQPGKRAQIQKKGIHLKSETRYQTVLAFDSSQNMMQAVEKKIVEPLQSDYYRKSNGQKLNAAQSIKSYNSMSPSRGIKNKNVLNKQNSANQKNSVGQNFDQNLGLKNKARILQKNADKQFNNQHLANSASRAMRESSKDSIRKKPYATVNNKGGKGLNKFGLGKNSVKPPTKKQVMMMNSQIQKQYVSNPDGRVSPQILKVSRSTLQMVPHQSIQQQSIISHSSQGSDTSQLGMHISSAENSRQQVLNDNDDGGIYTQLSDRIKKKQVSYTVQSSGGNIIKPLQRQSSVSQYQKKQQSNQLHYIPIGQKRGSLPPQQENLTRSLAVNSSASGSNKNQNGGIYSNQSQGGRTSDNKFASQERAMKMAEENMNKIDEILAQNQKHIQLKEKKQITTSQKILGHQEDVMDGVEHEMQSPMRYRSQVNQNTMINLNNNNIHANDNSTSKSRSKGQSKANIDKNAFNGIIIQSNEKMIPSDDMQGFKEMQKVNNQSPIDIPSSSNTSQKSQKTFSQSLVSNTNQAAPEIKKIGKNFNEIVKGLQIVEQNQQNFQIMTNQRLSNVQDPAISDIISKLYQVKSSYDGLIKNMAAQVNQLQCQLQAQPSYKHVPFMIQPERQVSQRVGINTSEQQYNKVSTQKEKLTPHGTHMRDPPHSASSQSRTRMDAIIAGTGGSMNKCKYCKGMGQAPSSNSASERQTYAVVSDRAVNTIDQPIHHSIESFSNQNIKRDISLQKFGPAADHITINLPIPQEGDDHDNYDKLEQKFNSEKKVRTQSQSVGNFSQQESKYYGQQNPAQQMKFLKEENKKVDILQEQNKKNIKDIQEKDKQIVNKDKQVAQLQTNVTKKVQELKDTQKKVRELEQLVNQLKKQKNDLTIKKNERSQSKIKKSQATQIEADEFLSEKELDLMVEVKQMERKIKKIEKEKTYNANKISKFIYFFFTLQNKGIPVNEIYENDGVKFIKTDRFQEIMGQNANQEENKDPIDKADVKDDKSLDLSFYSDDSYEYVQNNLEMTEISRFKNINNVLIRELDFKDLPEYETTDDDEEEECSQYEGQNPFEKTENDIESEQANQQLESPAPHNRLNKYMDGASGQVPNKKDNAIHITENDLGLGSKAPSKFNQEQDSSSKKAMSQKDYQKSIKYIENFYQQQSGSNQESSQSGRNRQTRQDDSGFLFDDVPKSVTEESSMIVDEKHNFNASGTKMLAPGTSHLPKKLYKNEKVGMSIAQHHGIKKDGVNQLMDNSISQKFDQSEKFDDSRMSIQEGNRINRVGHPLNQSHHGEPLEIMGITIDSQSFTQSIIDQSMTSEVRRIRKQRKQKEDLDGSRLYRDQMHDDLNDSRVQKQSKDQAPSKKIKINKQ